VAERHGRTRTGCRTVRVAIADWDGHVSPVFDTATHVRLVETGTTADSDGRLAELAEDDPAKRALRLVELGVNVLICGAISRPLESMIAAQGIRVISRVCGPTAEVIRSFESSRTVPEMYFMPGCCRQGGGRGRQRLRRRGGCGERGD
jgi:predicted Fe-Mo cluster-binding NifX family protein